MRASASNDAAAPAPVCAALNVPRTVFEAGTLSALPAELEALGVARPLLMTDKGLVKAGFAARAIEAFGVAPAMPIFDGITENPLFPDVARQSRREPTRWPRQE